jgi:hypothetical protein
MPKLTKIKRPDGQAEHYRFFKNMDSSRHWKVKMDFREAAAPAVASEQELAPANFALCVSASPVEDLTTGKAMRDGKGRAIVTDSWTHTFTEVEMKNPDFDPEARMMDIITKRVEAGEALLNADNKIKSLMDAWKKD